MIHEVDFAGAADLKMSYWVLKPRAGDQLKKYLQRLQEEGLAMNWDDADTDEEIDR